MGHSLVVNVRSRRALVVANLPGSGMTIPVYFKLRAYLPAIFLSLARGRTQTKHLHFPYFVAKTPDFNSVAIEVTEKESIMRNMMSRSKKLMAAAGAALIIGSVLGGISTSAQAATQPDAAALQYMVAEEKLAHDVYVTLGEEYGVRVFINIARSETQHQSAVATLLDRYGIKNPTLNDKVGVFDDPKLQGSMTT